MAKHLSFLLRLRAFLCFLLLRTCASYSNIDLGLPPLDHLSTGLMITGDPGSNAFGYSVSSAGDINNDGYDDIIVGAPWKSSSKGAAYVIYGGKKSSFSNIDLGTPLDPQTTGFMITGNAASDFFGRSVSAAGDINKDGYGDIIIGAYAKSVYKGAVYVIYGGEKSSMTNLDLSTTPLDPLTTGFMITGDAVNIYFGLSVSSAGDINKDGYADIIIGAPQKSGNKGAAYVIYGGEKSSMTNLNLMTSPLDPLTTGFMISGNANNDNLGFSVRTAGDINNDGYDDIIVGAYYKYASIGVAYVIYGGEKSSLGNLNFVTQTLDPLTTGFMITGNSALDYFGYSVSTAGDINDDGFDDLMIGSPYRNSHQGAAYVIYGGEKSSMINIDLRISPLDPLTTGFMITGNAAEDYFGYSVSSARDIKNDGYDDIIIGAYGKSSNTGATYVIFGGKKSSLGNINLATQALDPLKTGFMLTGNDAGNYFGWAASTAGDFNNDGYRDIIVGAYGKSNSKGAAYLIYGGGCPAFCDQCNSASQCTKCTSPKLLYQSECFDSCPLKTFVSTADNSCKDCPAHCSSCSSQESCQVCLQGYFLFNSQCVSSPSSSQQTQQNAFQAVSSAVEGIGSVVCVGNAVFPLSSLVSKIVQNTRYLNLSVTDDLAEIYQTWDTDLISWQVPNLFDNEEDQFNESPPLFARYELDSTFLVNFWPTILNIGIGLAMFGICFLLKNFLKRRKSQGWAYSLVQKLMTGSFNFALVQAYTCLDDALFYLVIDVKTNPFDNFFSRASFICAIIFLIFGCLLVLFNFWLVNKYQAIAKKNRKELLEGLNERNEYWELFYSDFNDNDLWSQSFLATLMIRSAISSLIIVVLYDYPLMQTAFLVILDGVIMLVLYFKSPFKTLRGKLAQWFFEIITLLVHIFTFILSLQDSFEKPSGNVKVGLSTGIIYLNTALVAGGLGFMFIEIYETAKAKLKERRRVKRLKKSANEENQEAENLNQTDSPPLKRQQKMARSNLSSDFQHNNSNLAILSANFEALESNFNSHNPFGQDMRINNGQRDLILMPISQRKLRILKPQPQRNEFEITGQAKNPRQLKNIVKISFEQKLPE